MEDIQKQLQIIKRGAVDLINEEELVNKLKKGKPLRVKAGFDPTAPDLHLGHTVLFQKMREFQELGHKAVFIIGDFTAMIGDPSGRSKLRPPLSEKEIKSNLKTYINQASKVLDMKKAELTYNSRWLKKMTFADVIGLASKYNVARMLERDDFKKRYQANENLSVHEFLYPLMQGYDSVAVKADVELGGTDQIFNLLVGRDIQSAWNQEKQVVLTMPLLVGTDGTQKMSKSYGNYIGITEAPKEMFGKVMSVSDELMWQYYELLNVDCANIAGLKSGHPMDAKKNLAQKIVERFHGPKQAVAAGAEFEKIFSKGGTPDDMPLHKTSQTNLIEVIAEAGLVSSKSEARRMIQQGGVYIDDERVADINHSFAKGEYVIKVGKRKFCKVRIKD